MNDSGRTHTVLHVFQKLFSGLAKGFVLIFKVCGREKISTFEYVHFNDSNALQIYIYAVLRMISQ